MITKIFLLIILLPFRYICPQPQLDSLDFFPLQTGNHWEYIYYYYEYPIFMFDTIIGDSTMPNGKTYKIMKETFSNISDTNYYLKLEMKMIKFVLLI